MHLKAIEKMTVRENISFLPTETKNKEKCSLLIDWNCEDGQLQENRGL